MNVFISWSGDTSHRVAKVLRDWIPSVIQAVEPYVSSEDIDKGTRWSSDIATELDKSSYGIICLTKQNIHAPWINF
ncbi:TIR domain-containing protein [Klebsiella pneumoniae]|nr:TIR domain-containing protein [Klebsiella pneumoniae]ELT0548704.1 TIR domain-containing protein [Klebsiella pneumoniae]MBC9990811.1 TIR domain-containing protein [Klebsiella pneumoniae]MBC9996226.1 TIR domain-containing protein [Klebsiella pneumoniae]MDW7482964.1 TIR domain-containing protein [Klebsiella pneumoniae]MEC5274442.1 TIR domain-containing protein [Klebsiella pneumoniae]